MVGNTAIVTTVKTYMLYCNHSSEKAPTTGAFSIIKKIVNT
jgi:hypothetical protein